MKDNRHYLYVVFLALIFVLGIYFVGISRIDSVLSYFGFEGASGITNNDRGTFGDSTGFINTLFSSLAFAGVILTLYWQIKENGKNKEEDHRKQFEDVFFHMTENFETIISGLKIEVVTPFSYLGDSWQLMGVDQKERQFVEGREVFRYLYEQRQIDGKYMIDAIITSKTDGYEEFMEGHLDHYFRYFYRILRYIDGSTMIDDKQKYRYASLLRAHMSSYELLIMHYNGLSAVGRKKLKPLLEKYSMLKNVREEKLSHHSIDEERRFFGEGSYYQDNAFGHECPAIHHVLTGLWLKIGWAGLATIVIVAFIHPFWNGVIVDVLMSKISGDSFPVFLVIFASVLYYVYRRVPADMQLLCDMAEMDKPSEEAKEAMVRRIIERCSVLTPITIIVVGSVILLIESDYYLTGGLSFCDLYVAGLAIVYELYTLICIAVKVNDLKYIKNIKLFNR